MSNVNRKLLNMICHSLLLNEEDILKFSVQIFDDGFVIYIDLKNMPKTLEVYSHLPVNEFLKYGKHYMPVVQKYPNMIRMV